jgi:hypothetical protein
MASLALLGTGTFHKVAYFALPAQDHEVIGVGHDARAEASLQPEHLPSQHEPAHVEIRQQG